MGFVCVCASLVFPCEPTQAKRDSGSLGVTQVPCSRAVESPECGSTVRVQSAPSRFRYYRGIFFFFFSQGGGSALDVAAETHVDRQCGEETLPTFVYKCADAVRSAEGVLKPHCQPMQMSGTTRGGRGGYIQYLLCVFPHPHLSFVFIIFSFFLFCFSSPPSLSFLL